MNIYETVQNISVYQDDNFFLIAGPCVVENENIVMRTAEYLASLSRSFQIPFIFKSSFTKANRTSRTSFSGIGFEEALKILRKVGSEFSVPVLTDIHEPGQAEYVAEYVDVLQIPSFLSRQTDLLLAAGATHKPVNIKKGQFSSPEAMTFAVEKIKSTGNSKILLTERGTTFGYNELVVDFKSIPIMQETGCPVVLDCTHALQKTNQIKGVTGGRPEFIPVFAKAGIAAGADGIFLETHPQPARALSDGENMLPVAELPRLLEQLVRIRKAV